ncbi:elongation factor Ts [Candidatus Roizmanbacteria bacterium]|nr:elongation factor Ts [Candidatus Roizmanbacteria bacterium]
MLDIKKLKQLREETGISIALCKKALEESTNDITKAKKLLSSWGVEKVKDKMRKTTSQGAIFSYVHHNKKIASLVELMCETDFVAGNTQFQKLGQELAMQIASIPAKDGKELLEQEYIRDSAKKISDLIKDAVLKFAENIKVGRFIRWQLGS